MAGISLLFSTPLQLWFESTATTAAPVDPDVLLPSQDIFVCADGPGILKKELWCVEMRFKDDGSDSGPRPAGSLPTEWPFGVILEDLECRNGTMYVVTREVVYRIPTQKFIRWLDMYATKVENDTLNAPSLEKIDEACRALKGAMLAEM